MKDSLRLSFMELTMEAMKSIGLLRTGKVTYVRMTAGMSYIRCRLVAAQHSSERLPVCTAMTATWTFVGLREKHLTMTVSYGREMGKC